MQSIEKRAGSEVPSPRSESPVASIQIDFLNIFFELGTGKGDYLSELQEHLKIPFHVPMSISILKCSDLLGFFNVCSS